MKNIKKVISTTLAVSLIAGAALVSGAMTNQVKAGSVTGTVSWYKGLSANGAANNTIKKGTKVKVKNLRNGKTTTVVINDRGLRSDRVLDMNKSAFAKVEDTSRGLFTGKLTW